MLNQITPKFVPEGPKKFKKKMMPDFHTVQFVTTQDYIQDADCFKGKQVPTDALFIE